MILISNILLAALSGVLLYIGILFLLGTGLAAFKQVALWKLSAGLTLSVASITGAITCYIALF